MNERYTVPEITPLELEDRLQSANPPVLVDVREPFEVKIADLPDHGQLRIPSGEFAHRVGELDPSAELVIYCRSGARSAMVTAVLMHNGYDRVLNLKGGILGWRADVDPSLTAY